MSVSPRTLQAWRARKCGPTFIRIGNRIKYDPRTLRAWMAARRNVPAPRKARPVTLAHRPVFSDRMAELIAREIERGFAGEVGMSAATYRRLAQAIRPIEGTLALALCCNGMRRPDGTVRLAVPRNMMPHEPGFDPRRDIVAVTYDPRSGCWTSDISGGQPGFDNFCGHVWRVQGRREGMAARDLLSFIGAAYLALLSEGRAA
ncbi:MAG: helix-turn-helix domain-containing protein [Nitrospiraceae bacterium]|nr:helix-turn-helix domain-containing protein [Nitrospiraceae bacterium]